MRGLLGERKFLEMSEDVLLYKEKKETSENILPWIVPNIACLKFKISASLLHYGHVGVPVSCTSFKVHYSPLSMRQLCPFM